MPPGCGHHADRYGEDAQEADGGRDLAPPAGVGSPSSVPPLDGAGGTGGMDGGGSSPGAGPGAGGPAAAARRRRGSGPGRVAQVTWIAGDRVGQRQGRRRPGRSIWVRHRQRRAAGCPTPGSTRSGGHLHVGIRPRSENAASMNGWENWPGARLTTEALKKGPEPSTSPNDVAWREAGTGCAATPSCDCPGWPAHR